MADFPAPQLLHGPPAIQVKDCRSCLLLHTIRFKIPFFLFFLGLVCEVVNCTLHSGLHNTPFFPRQSSQEEAGGSPSLTHRSGSTNPHKCCASTDLSKNVFVLTKHIHREKEASCTGKQPVLGLNRFDSVSGLFLLRPGEVKGREASASSCSQCKRGPFQSDHPKS